LGLIKSETCFNVALKVVTEFSNATSEKEGVVDAVFWMYGSGGDSHTGKPHIATTKPKTYTMLKTSLDTNPSNPQKST
jgi:hypothetical protein